MCASCPLFLQTYLQKLCKRYILYLEDGLQCVKRVSRRACAPLQQIFSSDMPLGKEISIQTASQELEEMISFWSKWLGILNSFKKLKIKIKNFKTYSIAADKLTNIFVMPSLSGLSTLATLKVLCKKKRADQWVSFNPILHTEWLDNHALTLKSNSAKYYFHEKSRFLYTFLKFCCESRKFKLSSKTFYFECYKCFKKVNLNVWQICHNLF